MKPTLFAPRLLLLAILTLTALALSAGCGGSGGSSGRTGGSGPASGGSDPAASGGGERVTVGDAEALAWGDGPRGVVLAHGAAHDAASWEAQAEEIAESGATVLAVEDTSAESVRAAVDHLRSERGARSVSLVGASAGSSGVLEVGRQSPGEVAQVVLLSGSGDVSGLGEYPKLFAASEGEGLAERARRMAEQAPGDRNEALIVGGDAHAQAIFDTPQGDRLLRAVVERVRRYG